MHEVKAILRREMLDAVVRRLHAIERLPGVTTFAVHGFGRRTSGAVATEEYGEVAMVQLEVVVPEDLVPPVLEAIQHAARTGRPGDGKIFISRVDHAVNIRSAKVDAEAL